MTAGIRSGTNNDGYIQVNGSDIITALSSGNVGIGTSSPSTKLHVNGTITATNFSGSGGITTDDWIVHTGDTDTKLGFPANGQIQFNTDGTKYLQLHKYSSVNFVEAGPDAHISLAANGANSRGIMIGDGNASSTGQLFLQAGGGSTGFGGGIRLYSHANTTNAGGVYIGKSLNSSGSIILGNGGTSPSHEYLKITSTGKSLFKSQGTNAVWISLLDNDSSNEIWRVGQASDGDGYVEVLEDGGTVGCKLDASGNSFTMGNFGIGVASPDGPLHIFSGSAGSVSPDAGGNELTLESSGNTGMSILSPGTGESTIFFGNPGTNGQKDGYIRYWHESHSTTANRRCLTFVTGGGDNERLRIGSDGTLTVSSETVIINRNAGDPYLTFQTSGTSNAVIYGGASTGLRGFTKPSGGSLTERVRITPAGQLITGGTATPYPTRSVTIQPVTGQTNTYLSIVAGSTSAVSAITFGDTAGQAAGNYAGMFEYYHSDDSLRYAQNASEKLRITTAGHLEFRNSTTSHQGLKWYKDSGRQVELTYGENNANVVLNIYRQDSQSGFPYGNLIVNTGSSSSPSQAIKVQTDKNIVLTGSLIMGNGQGIDFGNTPDGPNKSSEFLNDYEQGSWTPTNQYQTIQSSRDCRYWKIGHMVTINFDFTAGGSPSGGSQTGGYIESLPFTVHNSSGVGGRPGVIKLYDSYTGAASSLTNTCWMYAGANGTTLYIHHNDDDRIITRGESAGKRIMGTFTYRAA